MLIPELEELARKYVGDNGPVLYFVSVNYRIHTVTSHEQTAVRVAESLGEHDSVVIEKSDYGTWWENQNEQRRQWEQHEVEVAERKAGWSTTP